MIRAASCSARVIRRSASCSASTRTTALVLEEVAGLHQLVGQPEPGAVDELEHLVLVDHDAGGEGDPPSGAHDLLELIDEVDHPRIGVLGGVAHVDRTSRSRCSGETAAHRLDAYRRGHLVDVAAEVADLLDQRRRDEDVGEGGHQEHRVHRGVEAAVHQGHLEFGLEVADHAQPAHDRDRPGRRGKVDGESVKGGHLDALPRTRDRPGSSPRARQP